MKAREPCEKNEQIHIFDNWKRQNMILNCDSYHFIMNMTHTICDAVSPDGFGVPVNPC